MDIHNNIKGTPASIKCTCVTFPALKHRHRRLGTHTLLRIDIRIGATCFPGSKYVGTLPQVTLTIKILFFNTKTMGLFAIRHLSRFFRRSGPQPSNGTRFPSSPTSNSRCNLLPMTSNNPVISLCTTCSISLTFLAGATAILFVFTCWLATAGNLYTIYPYPRNHHNFHHSIDDHGSLGIILRPGESRVQYGQQRTFDLQDHEKDIKKVIVRPEITQEEVKEPEGRGKSNLWFKAEYTIEIPICEGGLAVKNGGACIHRDINRNGKRDGDAVENEPNWVPAIESVRISFCTGYGSEAADNGADEWEEEKSWDYIFPPRKGSSEIHAAAEWVYGVDKRFLEKWRSVDVPGRKHDKTFFKTEKRTPIPGSKPQWQFLLTTAGVYINADAWNIYEEEVTVEVPVGKIQTQRSIFSRSPSIRGTEVEKVLMWRWRGRYGGCPGEMDGREVVLEIKDVPESVEWVRDGGVGEDRKR